MKDIDSKIKVISNRCQNELAPRHKAVRIVDANKIAYKEWPADRRGKTQDEWKDSRNDKRIGTDRVSDLYDKRL